MSVYATITFIPRPDSTATALRMHQNQKTLSLQTANYTDHPFLCQPDRSKATRYPIGPLLCVDHRSLPKPAAYASQVGTAKYDKIFHRR